MKRDRFELLSAYLDGEVTPEERRLVQTWLSHDPTAKCLYDRLMVLRHGLREDDAPDTCEADVTLAGVFQCLNRRFRMVTMAGAGVVVLGVLNVLSGTVGPSPARWSLANQAADEVVISNTLQITLDQPAFPIPDPMATPADGTSLKSPGTFPLGTDL
ncbi:hypothetical protein GFS31_08750 [Leptolyngbya sp. BL0902]|uniref:anti-sigma factor family protein n=1 Tax=Leptolyngbya sp. BL0902 TaxID=1115757 RepID=UPI0018E80948|nr:zf-HC2 domain-containing protein [Leptolyngbya sp. BL0902]QQE64196.1 hypothetical protein GFS31_08750 [Leptolyngbya sp. BL0902]